MGHSITKEDLIAFEAEIAELFEQGQIRSPVHLSGGNEDDLIHIFEFVKPTDWVFSNHRSHYHALLKGIPKEWLKAEILKGHSITLNNAEYNFFSSAIVGGILPIAVGVAMALREAKALSNVWAFCGCMAAETGIFHECVKYATGHSLPVHFVVEDNGYSVRSPTKKVWGLNNGSPKIVHYDYIPIYPHQGASDKWIIF